MIFDDLLVFFSCVLNRNYVNSTVKFNKKGSDLCPTLIAMLITIVIF